MINRSLTDREVYDIIEYARMDVDDYHDWTRVGMALKLESEIDGFSIWDNWSRQSSKYDQSIMASKWNSFSSVKTSNSFTIGSLIKRAQANGFKFERGNEMNGEFDISKMSWEQIENDLVLTDNGIELAEKQKKVEPKNKTEQQSINQDNNIMKTSEKAQEATDEFKKMFEALESTTGTFTNDIQNAQASVYSNEEQLKYYKDRGINEETMLHYEAGWSNGNEKWNYWHIKGALIPGTAEGLAIRNANFEKRNQEIEQLSPEQQREAKKRNPKYFKPGKKAGAIDIPVGLKHVIKQPNLTDTEAGYQIPVFIFEGYFDVISLYEATGIDGISLNGTHNDRKVLEALKQYKIKRPIVLMLDNDSEGKKNQEKFYNLAKNAGFDVYTADIEKLYGAYKDANEFLQKDRDGFIKAIDEAKEIPVVEFEKEFNIGQKESFDEYIEWTRKTPPIKTGFDVLDSEDFLDGGLYPELYGIGALSSLGKTSFILQIADNIAKAGNDVLYISLEMLGHELRAKSISRKTLKLSYRSDDIANAKTTREILDGKRYSEYTEFQRNLIEAAKNEYFEETGKNLKIIDFTMTEEENITFSLIKRMVEKHKAIRGRAPVVFIDYLQILGQDEGITHSMSDKQIIDYNILKLKQLSTQYQTPVIVISSFNRANYNNPVNMESFKESGAIEYSCGVLIGIDRDIRIPEDTKDDELKFVYQKKKLAAIEREKETGIKNLKVVILKNRNGKSGGKDLFLFDQRYNNYFEKGKLEDDIKREEEAKLNKIKYSNKKMMKAK